MDTVTIPREEYERLKRLSELSAEELEELLNWKRSLQDAQAGRVSDL